MDPGEEAEGWTMSVCTHRGTAELFCGIRQVILGALFSYYVFLLYVSRKYYSGQPWEPN